MAKKNINSEDLNLSLTGSQLSASFKKPNSSRSSARSGVSGLREKSSSLTALNSTLESSKTRDGKKNKPNRMSSHHLNVESGEEKRKSKPVVNGLPRGTTSDDFLALFENSTGPKIRSANSNNRDLSSRKKPAWASVSSGGARQTASSQNSVASRNKFQHSIFQPSSARSTSSVETDYLDTAVNDERSCLKKSTRQNNNQEPTVTNNTLSPSIANNMTSQAMSPTLKMPFMDIENAFQNIKHDKTPVNLVSNGAHSNNSSANTTSANHVVENYIKKVNYAASIIQRWYRRILERRRNKKSENDMRQLFEQKRAKIIEQQGQFSPTSDVSEEERKRRRDEKAQKARQQAIKELKHRREDKAAEYKLKAEEEVELLKSEGKLIKDKIRNVSQKNKHHSGNNKKNFATVSSRNCEHQPITADLIQEQMQERSPHASHQSHNELHSHSLKIATEVGDGASGVATDVAANSSVSKTTLDDLMDTLKKLEEDELLDPEKKNKKRSTAWDDLDKTLSGSEENDYLTSDKIAKHNKPKEIEQPQLLSDEKLRSIFNFLDEVDRVDRLSNVENELNSVHEVELNCPPLLMPSGEELAEMEQATQAANEVTSTVLKQRLELEEKKRTISMLQKALNQQRELTIRHAKETEKDMKKRLSLQKDDSEETIKRHLSFIDQLIDDKKSLSERCEQLVREMKNLDHKFTEKIRQMENSHAVEMSKIKDINAAAEKLRREKWIDDKTKKIKEMTVKGLEPEIQRLIAKHKSELKKIKSIHEAELLESDERAGQRYINMTEELRDQLAKEKEAACARERELAKQRYEKQLQQEEEAYQSQRRRMYSEIQEEKDRLSQQAIRQRAEIDKLQRNLEDSHTHSVSALKVEYEKAREEQERRHATELKDLQERLRIEKEAWEENYMKKQETWLMQKERELKESVRKDRDKEIELVINRLEEDTVAAREECERVAENRIKRIRDKYETEMLELDRSERQAMEKYNHMKAQLTEIEGENERLKVIIKQKDQEIKDTKKLSAKLHNERDHVSDIVRQEFADRLVATEEENKRLKNEMSELKAKNRLELERAKSEIEVIQKSKEEEMEEVHKRVKQAIVKKEEVVTQIRQQYQAALKRADHLEGLLEQQRKQLLRK